MDLLIIFAIAWFIRQAVVDIKYAALGKTPPRYQVKMARLSAAGKTSVKPRYGSRDYFADLWADALEARTEKRREQSAKKKSADPVERVVQDDAPAAPEPPDPEPVVTEPKPEPKPEPTKQAHTPGQARVIPMFPTKTEEVPVMSEGNALDAAITHCRSISQVFGSSSAAGGGETFINGLEANKVTGEQIAAVRFAQSKSAEAAAAWAAAAQILGKQKSVQEAYSNVPDAGTKEFLLNGR